jgi:hypothetical protein
VKGLIQPQCVVATWNREAQSRPNLAPDILPWRKYIELEIDEVSGADVHFWPSNGWILARHGCFPFLCLSTKIGHTRGDGP